MARKPTEEESNLFRQAVADLKPFKQPTHINQSAENLEKIFAPTLTEKFYQRYCENEYLEPLRGDTRLEFHQNLPHKLLRKLRQGQYNAEAILDLHGYTVNEAALALDDWLTFCLESGKRVIRLVHGKGPKAILKTQVNSWLQDTPDILAFCSAKPQDGGTGALYILLKKQSNSEDDDHDNKF